jgi:hypothetical protein
MKRNLFTIALSTIVSIFCLGGFAHGQTGPGGGQGSGSPAPSVTPTGALSEADLEAAIKALDPSYKVRPTADNQGKVYNLKINRDGWTYAIQIESFASQIWINAELSGVITSPQNIPAGPMAELLKQNFNIGPAHFALVPMADKSGFKLFLCRMFGRYLTTESFNGNLNDFLKTVKDTYPVWSEVK